MEPTGKSLTIDDFFDRIVKPKAEQGDPMAIIMMEAQRLIKDGKMTPELIRELAKKAVP